MDVEEDWLLITQANEGSSTSKCMIIGESRLANESR